MADLRPQLRSELQAVGIEHDGQPAVLLLDAAGLSDRQACLAPEAVLLLQEFNGQQTLFEIQHSVRQRYGIVVPLTVLERLVRDLDECYFLASPRFASYLSELQDGYRRRAVRAAVHAGRAYPAEPASLRALLDEMLAAGVPRDGFVPDGSLRALVVPHIDYARGHECYGFAYNTLRDHALGIERFVVIGTNHHGRSHTLAATRKPFDTPLGTVDTDVAFLDAFERKTTLDLFECEFDHLREHSIELQAVFLKHVLADRPFRMVPLLCSAVDFCAAQGYTPANDPVLPELLAALRATIEEAPGNTCVIAAVDLSHIGRYFGDDRDLDEAWLAEIARQDQASLECLSARDAEGFYRSVMDDSNARRVCGLSPLYVMLQVSGVRTLHLLQYKQCVSHETQCTVTCAAMAGC